MATDVALTHRWEAAHCLPQIDTGGKCQNLHGHSWEIVWTLTADATKADGTVIEFGKAKRVLREWVDNHLDHGVMLGADDPLTPVLVGLGHKVYVFGEEVMSSGLRWPTVENTARLLHRVAASLLISDGEPGVWVSAAAVRETANNAAVYRP